MPHHLQTVPQQWTAMPLGLHLRLQYARECSVQLCRSTGQIATANRGNPALHPLLSGKYHPPRHLSLSASVHATYDFNHVGIDNISMQEYMHEPAAGYCVKRLFQIYEANAQRQLAILSTCNDVVDRHG